MSNLQQPVGDLDGMNLPQFVGEIPWGHNIQLLSKIKDPYHLDFLAVGPDISERQLEIALLERIKNFLLELGIKALGKLERAENARVLKRNLGA